MSLKTLSAIAISSAMIIATTAVADGHLSREQQGAIAARQAHMTLYGFNIAPLGAMAQGQMPYDAEVAAAAAANLAAVASLNEDRYWVEGTDSSAGGNRARAEIWSDPEGFAAEIEKIAATTAALAAVAGNGLEEMQAAFGPVGQSCGSCHESYRAPRD
jgi:cytochrome c556